MSARGLLLESVAPAPYAIQQSRAIIIPGKDLGRRSPVRIEATDTVVARVRPIIFRSDSSLIIILYNLARSYPGIASQGLYCKRANQFQRDFFSR